MTRAAFYGAGKSLLVSIGGVATASTRFASATCRTPPRRATGRRRRRGRLRSTRFSAVSRFPPIWPDPVTVTYSYGFPAEIGGGPYSRAGRFPLDRAAHLATQPSRKRRPDAGAGGRRL